MFCFGVILEMPKIQRMGKTHWVGIPAYICKLKGWSKGQELYFDIDQRTGKVVIDKLEEIAGS